MYKINEEKMFYDTVENRTIVINSDTGIYYGINNFSTAVFESVIKGIAIPDILAAINKIPNVPADMEQRLLLFVKDLQDSEIIIKGTTVNETLNIDTELVLKDNFALSVTAFADAQDMLLADPIPDMEEFDGWQPPLG
jgi:hypothetical protein